MVYESGTNSISLSGRTVGVGVGGGKIGGGVAHTESSGTSRSLLAKRVAPPEEKGYLFKFFFGFLASLGVMVASGKLYWFSLAILALCIYFSYRCFQFNRTEWPKEFAHWRGMWICNKCGHSFHRDQR